MKKITFSEVAVGQEFKEHPGQPRFYKKLNEYGATWTDHYGTEYRPKFQPTEHVWVTDND